MAEFCTLRGRRDTALPLPGSAAAQMLAPSYNWLARTFGGVFGRSGAEPRAWVRLPHDAGSGSLRWWPGYTRRSVRPG